MFDKFLVHGLPALLPIQSIFLVSDGRQTTISRGMLFANAWHRTIHLPQITVH